jgi:hypothetical protein
MHQELATIIERCAASARDTGPTDLVGLAQLHTDLQAVRMLSSVQAGASPELPATVDRASSLIEKLVLNEVENAAGALADVGRLINEVQALLSGTAPSSSAPTDVASPGAAAGAKAPAIIAEERVVAAGDAPLALEFVGEASGHLDAAEASLLKLEEDPGDTFTQSKASPDFWNSSRSGLWRTPPKHCSIWPARENCNWPGRASKRCWRRAT